MPCKVVHFYVNLPANQIRKKILSTLHTLFLGKLNNMNIGEGEPMFSGIITGAF